MQFQFSKAITFAMEAHKDQKYGDKPYLYHLDQVDQLVTKTQGRNAVDIGDRIDNLRAIAFLHDVIEDTDTTYEELYESGFNEHVVEAVGMLSKVEGESYEQYIEGVLTNELATVVKLCDTSANLMNSIMEGNVKRINKYSKQIQLLGGFDQYD